MKVIEQNQDRLILQSSNSFWGLLLGGVAAVIVGLFFFLIGLVIQKSNNAGIIALGIGSAIIFSVPYFAINFSTVNTFTFDKSQDYILREQRRSLGWSDIKLIKFPAHLIVGVEIIDSMDAEVTSYNVKLLLASVYWRIHVTSNSSDESAATTAKLIAQFLNIDYFPYPSKAPASTWQQKASKYAEPWQFHWKYLESEAERLQHYVADHPQDAEAHQDLGIALHFSNQKEAVVHLQKAEKLFEMQQKIDCAAIVRVMQALINRNY